MLLEKQFGESNMPVRPTVISIVNLDSEELSRMSPAPGWKAHEEEPISPGSGADHLSPGGL